MNKNLEIIQEECSDCGICSLASIINYYGGHISLETLRFNTNTSSNGTNAYELINCAKKYGFNSYGKTVEKIENIKTPFIAHLRLENDFYHFVVVYKVRDNNLLIMDPAIGFKKIKLIDFNKLFTGVILCFSPISTIPRFKENKFIIKKLLDEIKTNKNNYIIILIISFITLILTTIINLQVDLLSINKNIIYYFLLIIFINELFILIRSNLLINNSIKFNTKIIKEFIIHIFKLPSNYLKLKTNGEIVTRFNELNELSINIFNIVINILFNVLLCIIIGFIIFFKTPKLIYIIFLYSLLYILFNLKVYKKLIKEIRYSISLEEDYNSNIVDYIANINTIKNLNIYNYFINNVNNNLFNKNNINKSINKKIFRVNFINNLFINILTLLVLYFILKNNYNLNNSLLIFMLFNFYLSNIKGIIDYYPTIILYKSIIKKNSDFLSFERPKLPLIPNKFNFIQVKNLNYFINGNKILDNINLNIMNKDKIFINGPSGIGKSTLMKILNKEIINYKGLILKDNINIKEYNLSNLITYTHQDESLFNDTIYNNILLGENIEKCELDKVLRICRINDINIIKEIGLNSLIINNSCVSGGEKNRIILARSLIHSKKILILDEVLKEVDKDLEVNIIKDIINEYKDKTIIYISHKNVGFLFNKVLTLGKE